MSTPDATATILRPQVRRRPTTPAPGEISCLLRGRDALVAVAGPVDRAAVTRIEILIHGLRNAGAARVLVDMLGVTTCDRALTGALHRQRRELLPHGGWLIVDGAPGVLHDELDLPLPDAFRIYQEARSGR